MSFENLVDLLCHRASIQNEESAYIFLKDGEKEELVYTYSDLHLKAQKIAELLQIYVNQGDRVLLIYPPGLEFISAFFGCLYAGVVAVPVYPPRPNQSLVRLQTIIDDAQVSTAITTAKILTEVDKKYIKFPDLKALSWIITDNLGNNLEKEWQKPVVSSDSLALLQYTSGSTGTPKGVMISHGNLLHNLELIHKSFEDTSSSLGVSWLPFYHDMGLIGGVLEPLYVGAPMVFMSPVDFLQSPIRWLNAISRYQATTSGGPNFAYDLCVRRITDEQKSTLDLSSWEIAFNGAEPIRSETLERFAASFESCGFRRTSFYPCYGLAESTLLVSSGVKATEPVTKTIQQDSLEKHQVVPATKQNNRNNILISCGKNRLDQRLVIAHPETFKACLQDEIGEIWVSGDSVAKGYWNRPQETEVIFNAYLSDSKDGPFLRTGDLGFIQDNNLFVTGRLKDLIIIRGRNHYPQDIELTVEQSHPALRAGHGAVFSIDVDDTEQLVVTQEVDRRYLKNLDFNEIIVAICREIAQHHEIQVYAILLLKTGSIPKTSSGKIQRHACRSGFLNNSLEVVSDWITDTRMKTKFRNLQKEVESLEQQILKPLKSSITETDNLEENKTSHQKIFQQAQAIQDWLTGKICEYLKNKSHKIESHEIDIDKPLYNFALDSVEIMDISCQLENWLGCRISSNTLYEHPTIKELAKHLELIQLEKSIGKVDQLTNQEIDFLFDKLYSKEVVNEHH